MAWITVGSYIRTVDRLRKDSGKRGFADTMEAEEYVSMVECLCAARIGKQLFHEILTNDVREVFRAIFLVEGHLS